ncbi:uncharacterized protein LOC117790019 [Drosophila innubila]|uniref:uncharacterized protein LOC117790019 n=1 Tax=Drosophila innubila TaxID=198719 RepID=UPI00148D8B23|nr:uncharacterized protein LOC117790019 [Drosophila innubila]
MSDNRRIWTPNEVNILLRLWLKKLKLFHGKTRTELSKELQVQFQNEGIEMTDRNILSKMAFLKWQYKRARRNKFKQRNWKYYKRLDAIFNTAEDANTINDDELNTKVINGEECSRTEDCLSKKNPSRNAKQDQVYSNSTPSRRVWDTKKEEIFLRVWQKHARDLAKKNIEHAYEYMRSELNDQGIKITVAEIKSKMKSLTRTFRKFQKRKDPHTRWIHYTTVAELLKPTTSDLPELPENNECSANAEKLNDEALPSICTKTEDNPSDDDCEIVSISDESKAKVLWELFNDKEISIHSSEGIPDLDDAELDMLQDISIEDTGVTQNSTQIAPESQRTREFGEFVIKELSMLSDDLLIEAKRDIYSIICAIQIRQLQANKTTH